MALSWGYCILWFSSIPDSGFSLRASGQVHAVATLSRATEEMTPGAIMYGSQFLVAQCMLSSLLSRCPRLGNALESNNDSIHWAAKNCDPYMMAPDIISSVALDRVATVCTCPGARRLKPESGIDETVTHLHDRFHLSS